MRGYFFITLPFVTTRQTPNNNSSPKKFKCGFQGCNQLIGSKAGLKKHKKWHWDINEKKRKRDEQLAKEKQRLEEQEKEKERQNLRKKSKRKVTATASSPAKLVVPSTSETVIGSSAESTESTESSVFL